MVLSRPETSEGLLPLLIEEEEFDNKEPATLVHEAERVPPTTLAHSSELSASYIAAPFDLSDRRSSLLLQARQ